jgi:DNA polymerase III delta prime subunit
MPQQPEPYPWIPIYRELGARLLDYRDRQKELIEMLAEARKAGHKVVLLTDRDDDDHVIPLTEMDPFTFFASFNRTGNYADRAGVLQMAKERFSLESPVPETFEALPIVNAQASWFFPYRKHRQQGDVASLWDLATSATSLEDPAALPVDLFDRCLRIRSVGMAKLTMGLFWIRPDIFLPFDANTREYLSRRGITATATTGSEYVDLLQTAQGQLKESLVEISDKAYSERERLSFPELKIDQDKLRLAVERTLRPILIEEGQLAEDGPEGYQHHRVIPQASRALQPDNLKRDAVAAVIEAIDQHVNLLSHFEVSKAHDFLREADPAEVLMNVEDLLYGSDALDLRLGRFLEWSDPRRGEDEKVLSINSTVASYLLAVVDPLRNAFCKPDTYRKAAVALLGNGTTETDPIRRQLHANQFYSAVLDLLRRELDNAMSDLMHVHIAFYLMQASREEPDWDHLVREPSPVSPTRIEPNTYSIEEAVKELFVDRETFEWWLDVLRSKKNIILQGPPGVGKTFVARRIAYALMGERERGRVEMVQFHQSYGYEDFIQGYRPAGEGGFDLRNGVFFEFCERAERNPEKQYVFIIDEINRGNLSKIFGELMMLIEPDKRGRDHAIPLTYSPSGERFAVPENVYLLGMMNTADRSLAMVDYALRRRFAFIDLEPAFGQATFKAYLENRGVRQEVIEQINESLHALNEHIRRDTAHLGPGFCIGHSYFCPTDDNREYNAAWYERVIRMEIAPLIREYWFDDADRARRWISTLLNGADAA